MERSCALSKFVCINASKGAAHCSLWLALLCLVWVNVQVIIIAFLGFFCLSMSQLVDANPYKKMAFLDSQKAKIFPAAQPQWWAAGGAVTLGGLGPELKSLNAPPLPAPDPEPSPDSFGTAAPTFGKLAMMCYSSC